MKAYTQCAVRNHDGRFEVVLGGREVRDAEPERVAPQTVEDIQNLGDRVERPLAYLGSLAAVSKKFNFAVACGPSTSTVHIGI